MWYACWQNPDWQRAFRKGPMSKKAATDACRGQWKRRPMALMWLQSETGERELYSPNDQRVAPPGSGQPDNQKGN